MGRTLPTTAAASGDMTRESRRATAPFSKNFVSPSVIKTYRSSTGTSVIMYFFFFFKFSTTQLYSCLCNYNAIVFVS